MMTSAAVYIESGMSLKNFFISLKKVMPRKISASVLNISTLISDGK